MIHQISMINSYIEYARGLVEAELYIRFYIVHLRKLRLICQAVETILLMAKEVLVIKCP
jgi:hypothetical protein